MPATVSPDYVYLDYAATAPLCEEALEAMKPYLTCGRDNLALNMNANSLHSPGRAAFEALEAARKSIARDIGASRPSEVIFTSGSTESDDTVLLGVAPAAAEARRVASGSFTPHVIVSDLEHEAVLMPAKRLEQQGFRVTRLRPDSRGFITADALEEAIDADTVLVSIQAANSELGSVEPVRELAAIAHAHGALFHVDATQALGKMPLDVREWDVDVASFSAHKVGGPKGIGALYVKARTPLFGVPARWRAGGGPALRARRTSWRRRFLPPLAARSARWSLWNPPAWRELRDELYEKLSQVPGVRPTVDVPRGSVDFLPNIVHVIVSDLESETLILRLDMKGFGVSGGSACSSHSLEPSHVLRSIGVEGDDAYGALRISMGRYTTAEDIDRFLIAFDEALNWNRG